MHNHHNARRSERFRRFWTGIGSLGLLIAFATFAGGAPSAEGDDPAFAADRVPGDLREGAADSSDTLDLEALQQRALRAQTLLAGVEDDYLSSVAPIERVLRSYRDDQALASRVARSLVREARAVDVEPRLLLAVLLVENPWLDPDARSSVGAIGLMQVMPLHRGQWPGCAADLETIESNICHGARIFAHYFASEDGDIERALLRYNGCVRGTNTPDCHTYPQHVFARAGKASVLAWVDSPGGTSAASP